MWTALHAVYLERMRERPSPRKTEHQRLWYQPSESVASGLAQSYLLAISFSQHSSGPLLFFSAWTSSSLEHPWQLYILLHEFAQWELYFFGRAWSLWDGGPVSPSGPMTTRSVRSYRLSSWQAGPSFVPLRWMGVLSSRPWYRTGSR